MPAAILGRGRGGNDCGFLGSILLLWMYVCGDDNDDKSREEEDNRNAPAEGDGDTSRSWFAFSADRFKRVNIPLGFCAAETDP